MTASMAQEIGQTAIAFEEVRLSRKPTSVTVVLGGDTLAITMHGVLSRAEQLVAATPIGAAQLQEFHQSLFRISSNPLTREIERITGLELRKTAQDTAAAAM